MNTQLYIDTLTENQIIELEKTLRPGKSSQLGFPGIDEKLKDIIYADANTLKSLNITHNQIADRLEQAINNELKSEGYIVKSINYRGWQIDPFEKESMNPYSGTDFTVINPDGEKIAFPGLIIKLIREYQFFEGKGTSYRLDPSDTIRVLKIKPGAIYSNNTITKNVEGKSKTVYRKA